MVLTIIAVFLGVAPLLIAFLTWEITMLHLRVIVLGIVIYLILVYMMIKDKSLFKKDNK